MENIYLSTYFKNLTNEEKYRYLTNNDNEILKYKERVLKIVKEKGLGSYMNNTKWLKLQKEMSNLEFPPAYLEKLVTDNEFKYAKVETEKITFLGNWTPFYLEGMPLFFDIEYLVLVPKRVKHIGKFIKHEIMDISEELNKILTNINIPFEIDNGNFVIYGYK